jgi:hypothetical protein
MFVIKVNSSQRSVSDFSLTIYCDTNIQENQIFAIIYIHCSAEIAMTSVQHQKSNL